MTDRNAQPDVLGGSVSVSDTGASQRRRGALRGDQLTLPRAMLDPLIVGVLAAAVSLGGAGRPSFWYDEAATISASYSRSLGQLWQMLGNVDAVDGLYYLLMHGWFKIFPPTEFWSRAPSGLAVGGAAAGSSGAGQAVLVSHCRGGLRSCVRDLAPGDVGRHRSSPVCDFDDGRRVADGTARLRHTSRRRVGLAVLRDRPGDVDFARRVSGAFVSRVRRFHLRLPAQPNRGPCGSRLRRFWWAVAVTPFLVAAVGQTHQISWVAPIGHRTIEDVTIQQYFERSPPFALLSALVVATAIVWWLLHIRAPSGGRSAAVDLGDCLAVDTDRTDRRLVGGGSPVYTPRYLCFTAPAMAVVLGVCIGAVGRHAMGCGGCRLSSRGCCGAELCFGAT